MQLRYRNIIFLLSLLFILPMSGYAIDWGNAKETLTTLLDKYTKSDGYMTIYTDEVIGKDGSVTPSNDTVIIYKYKTYGYLETSTTVVMYNEKYDIMVKKETKEIYVQQASKAEISEIEKQSGGIKKMLQSFAMYDSARVNGTGSNMAIQLFFDVPFYKNMQLQLTSEGWIKNVLMFYKNDNDFVAQRTNYVQTRYIGKDDLMKFSTDNYFTKQKGGFKPTTAFSGYTLHFGNE